MPDLDERVVAGLRAFADRAPVDADTWDETGRYVKKHRRQRQWRAGAVAAVLVAAVGVTAAITTTRGSDDDVQVVATSTTVAARPPAACPSPCAGTARADVNGDGELDTVGYMGEIGGSPETTPETFTLRVVFADGSVVETDVPTELVTYFWGASDVNGDGQAEIFLSDLSGAHAMHGVIYRWNGRDLARVLVNEVDGTHPEFEFFIDAAAYQAQALRCEGDRLVTVSVGRNADDGWTGTEVSYAWQPDGSLTGLDVQEVSYPPQADQAPAGTYTLQCPGLSDAIPGD
jgi:hypothetical protein